MRKKCYLEGESRRSLHKLDILIVIFPFNSTKIGAAELSGLEEKFRPIRVVTVLAGSATHS